VESTGFSRLKRFCTMLAVIVATIAMVSVSSPVLAAAPAHIALVARLNADGSLTVSQRDKEAVIALPSIKALPAQIDALLPRKEDRKKLALAADTTVPWSGFLKLMNVAKDAGFGEVGILRSEKEPSGEPAELTIHFEGDGLPPLTGEPLFVSVGEDGNVILSLGIGENAHGTTASLAGALDAAKGLVPKGRHQKKAYLRADFAVRTGTVVELLHQLYVIGFTKIGIVGEEMEKD